MLCNSIFLSSYGRSHYIMLSSVMLRFYSIMLFSPIYSRILCYVISFLLSYVIINIVMLFYYVILYE